MDETRLRIEAEKHRTVTNTAWRFLDDLGHVQDALGRDFDEDKVAEIVKAIDYYKAMWGGGAKVDERFSESAGKARINNGEHTAPFAVDLADVERERALLLTDAQVRAATANPRVQRFRERHLPDGLLAPESAEQFLRSNPQEIAALGSFLHKHYGWHEGEAKWWALTGDAPSARPVRVSYRATYSLRAPSVYLITIEAPPWVSVETVQGAFSEMRKRMHAERKPPGARSLRVVRFVEKLRNSAAGEDLSFREMCRRWNEDNPDEAFSEPRTFETAYRRTVGILRRQYNTEIEREETPELRRQYARSKRESERILERFVKHRPPQSFEQD